MDQPPQDENPQLAGKFYRGTILKLFPGAQSGVIRSETGREIPFTFAFVDVLGERRRFDDLQLGMKVGFDVAWTSKGLCVSVLRILD